MGNAKNGNLTKSGNIFDSICDMMQSVFTNTTITLTDGMGGSYTTIGTYTNCGPVDTWQPYCSPAVIGNCQDVPTPTDPTIFFTVSWNNCNGPDSTLPEGPKNPGECRVTWLGQDFYNGQTIEMCPTSYTVEPNSTTKTFGTGTVSYLYYSNKEEWARGGFTARRAVKKGINYNINTNTTTMGTTTTITNTCSFNSADNFLGFPLLQSATRTTTTMTTMGATNTFTDTFTSAHDFKIFTNSNATTSTEYCNGLPSSSIVYNNLNKILLEPPATQFDFLLKDNWFGQYTSSNGTTYKWERGNGW